jgi:NAD-dependent deacetylase
MQFSEILLEKMSSARRVVVMTGAGVSAESGIATFRDPDGLWTRFNPMELASIDGFMSNSKLVWEWYQYRRRIVRDSQPNPGHYAIAEMEKMFEKFTLTTQNVDRLHQRAGSQNVYELHGNIIENRCFQCSMPFTEEISPDADELPNCNICGGKIRPCVVWFGEMLPADVLDYSERESSRCDLFFSVGTSSEVYPAAALPFTAKSRGAYVVEVNLNVTSFSHHAHEHLQGPSGIILPELIAEFKKFKNIRNG